MDFDQDLEPIEEGLASGGEDLPTLVCRLTQVAEDRADTVAVVSGEAGELHLSTASIDLWSNQLAHHLRRFGVRFEVPVGIWLGPTFEKWIAVLGVLKAGGYCLFLDASSVSQYEGLEDKGLEDNPRLLISQTGLISEETLSKVGKLWETVWLDLHWDAISAWSSVDSLPSPSASQLACRVLEPRSEISHGDIARCLATDPASIRVPVWSQMASDGRFDPAKNGRPYEAWQESFWLPLALEQRTVILPEGAEVDSHHYLEEQRIGYLTQPASQGKEGRHTTADERAEKLRQGRARQRQRLVRTRENL